jgi:NAD(P)-dependent dehydrogenase (short-subunit alcohol dehydrogenase family)
MEALMAVALVTGTSSGIGLATAVALARAGHTVAATMRNLNAAGDIERIVAVEKLPLVVFELDINDDASVDNSVAGIVSRYGPIDILVNNAGIPGGGAIEETSLELFRNVMETNFFGGLRCIKAVVTSMRERRKGVIVNVTSVAGRVALSPQAAYASSKWAFEALSEILAQELKAFNVRVAIVEPGVIATAIFKKGSPLVENSPYPHLRRLRAIFAASLTSPTPPDVVAKRIVEIVDGDSWQLRYLVGPDAQALLERRKQKTDEQSITEFAQTDEEFKARVKKEWGLDIQL